MVPQHFGHLFDGHTFGDEVLVLGAHETALDKRESPLYLRIMVPHYPILVHQHAQLDYHSQMESVNSVVQIIFHFLLVLCDKLTDDYKPGFKFRSVASTTLAIFDIMSDFIQVFFLAYFLLLVFLDQLLRTTHLMVDNNSF